MNSVAHLVKEILADLFSTNKPNAWPLLGAQDTRKYHLSSNNSWTKRATELTKNSNCSPTNTFRKRYFRTFLLECIIFEISGKNNITTENTLVFPMFLAVICFSHLSKKIMHLSKNVCKIFSKSIYSAAVWILYELCSSFGSRVFAQ